MTAAFDEFMDQYHLTGQEKAQGYSNSHFIGLNGAEKQAVFDLLMREITAPGTVHWLFLLEPEKANSAVLNFIHGARDKAGLFRLHHALYNHNGNDEHIRHILQEFEEYPDWEKREAILLAAETKKLPDELASFCKKQILESQNTRLVRACSDTLLRTLGFKTESEEQKILFYKFRKDLEANDLDIKNSALDSLGL